MLAMSDRDSPCSARISPSSLGRVTVITPSEWETSIGAVTCMLSVPFGPLTVTERPSMVTSTPLGTVTGIRPIRDMADPLPDVGEHFPAHALLVRLLVGHQAGGCRDDGHAKAAEHPRQVVLARIDPQPGLRDPLEPGDGALAAGPELERDDEVPADLGVLDLPARDVTLLLEDLRDMDLDLGMRHRHGVVICRVGVAQPGQHVCDRVGHGHGLMALLAVVSAAFRPRTFGVVGGRAVRPGCLFLALPAGSTRWTWCCPAVRRGAPSCGSRSGTARTCGTRRAAARSAS